MKWLDALTEKSSRSVARQTSRRSFLTGLGTVLVSSTAIIVGIANEKQ